MPVLCVAKIIRILCLLIILAEVYSYTEYPMESDKICHPFSAKATIKLPDIDDGGVIVKPNHMFDLWNPPIDKMCRFVFKTHRHTGLFAVIQNISFRRNGTQCIDYVQFKEDGHKSKWFCGETNVRNGGYQSNPDSDESSEVQNFLRWNSSRPEFRSSKGEIETRIFISKERLLPGETLDLTIVYTPYKDCDKLKDYDGKYQQNSNNTCILKSYYCDTYRNCAFDSCMDEAGCEILVSNGTGTKVTVGAVTTLFLSFLLFVMCLWTCRKHKKLCWSPDCAGPNHAGNNSQPIDLRQREASGRSVIPTAPMLDESTARPAHDKDLPPSYDSLFPEQAVPAAT